MTSSPHTFRPDPRVSVRLPCPEQREEAIRRVVAPLYRTLDELAHDTEDGLHLWMFRSHRPIEHLELHVHGPAALEAEIRDRISGACARADGVDWIRYRPSDVIFGGPPFQEDEGFRDGFTRGLAVAGRKIAETVESADEPLPFGRRQVMLWGLVIPGLQALALSADRRCSYLRYHRDWLMRFPLLRRPDRKERMAHLGEHFDQRTAAMEGALASLRSAMGEAPTVDTEPAGSEPAPRENTDESERRWFRSVRTLQQRILPLCDRWDPQQDPWAERPEFAPFFKLFHIAANPLGLTLPEEAFTYHLLLRAAAPETISETDTGTL